MKGEERGDYFIVVITNVMIIMGVHHTNCGGSSIGCCINNGQYDSRSFYLKKYWGFCFVWKIHLFFGSSGLRIKEKLNNHDFPPPSKEIHVTFSPNICLLKVIYVILAWINIGENIRNIGNEVDLLSEL